MNVTTAATVQSAKTEVTDLTTTEAEQYSPPRTPPGATPSPNYFPTPAIKTTPKSFLMNILTTPSPTSDGSGSVGIIILVVIIAIALLAALICYVARSKGRRYSMDLSSRPDDVQIPLSTVEHEAPPETITPNGLQFEGTEDTTEKPQETDEPETQPEDKTAQNAEPEKSTVDASAECAAPPADPSEDQSKQDVPEKSPAAPEEPSAEDKADDEGAALNTSVEPLKESNEPNENNSNCTVLPQRGARDAEAVWDTSLDSMV